MRVRMTTIVWFRRDLRLSDQSALLAAVARGRPITPVYILDDDTPKHRRMGGASRWWLHHSLQALDAALRERGSRLILRRGSSPQALAQLAREVNASAIHCLRHYEPWWRNAERALQEILPVGSVKTGSGGQFKIYTPFWRALAQHMPPAKPRAAPKGMPPASRRYMSAMGGYLDIDMQKFAQLARTARQLGFGKGNGPAHLRGDFLVGIAFGVVQPDHAAGGVGELMQGGR